MSTLDELRNETLIVMQDGAGVRQMIEDELQRVGLRLRDLTSASSSACRSR